MQCLRSAFLFESANGGVSLLPFSRAILTFCHFARAASMWVWIVIGGIPARKSCMCVCGALWHGMVGNYLQSLGQVVWVLCATHRSTPLPSAPFAISQATWSHRRDGASSSAAAADDDDWHFGRPGFAVVIVMLLSSLLSSTWLWLHS